MPDVPLFLRLTASATIEGVSIMGSQLLSPNSEAAIWARLMQAQKDELSSEAAKFLLAIDLGERDRQRMVELADRS
jgi:hypothetical protein